MTYQCETEVTRGAQMFSDVLAQRDIVATVLPDTLRDYMIKLAIVKDGKSYGRASLNYSPNKHKYRLQTTEMNDPILNALLGECLEVSLNGSSVQPPSTVPMSLDGAEGAGKDPELAAQDPVADLEAELRETSASFCEFCADKGVQANAGSILNKQFARIKVALPSGEQGTLDLYNTRKKPMYPRFYDFTPAAFQAQLERLWTIFKTGAAEVPDVQTVPLSAVEHYYQLFKPYRQWEFDFVDLAAALVAAWARRGMHLELERLRYDFDALEQLVVDLNTIQ